MDHYSLGFRVLQVTLALLAFIVGIDKFIFRLVKWDEYISPLLSRLIPLPPILLVKLAGALEVAGSLVLLFFPRPGAFLAFTWLLLTGINLAMLKLYVFSLRDFALAFAALAMGLLTAGPACNL